LGIPLNDSLFWTTLSSGGAAKMRERLLDIGLLLVLLVSLGILSAQVAQQNVTFLVNGLPGRAPVLQVNGKSYVEVGALARIINGSVASDGNQITLTLPASSSSTDDAPDRGNKSRTAEFSKAFLKAGIEEMSVIREWRSALVNAVQNGYALTDEFVAGYQSQAGTNLRLTSVAISTDSDRSAFQLLSNEFDSMQKLSNKILSARKNMNYIPRDALKDDPLDQKILNCARSLASMAASGQFLDDGSCS
jgi:hypothetical protein